MKCSICVGSNWTSVSKTCSLMKSNENVINYFFVYELWGFPGGTGGGPLGDVRGWGWFWWRLPAQKSVATPPVFSSRKIHGQRLAWATIHSVAKSQTRLGSLQTKKQKEAQHRKASMGCLRALWLTTDESTNDLQWWLGALFLCVMRPCFCF